MLICYFTIVSHILEELITHDIIIFGTWINYVYHLQHVGYCLSASNWGCHVFDAGNIAYVWGV